MRLLMIIVGVAMATSAIPASASPEVQYNSLNGNIYLVNDSGGAIFNLKSSTGRLNVPTFPKGPIGGGAKVDAGDLPNYLAFLNMPIGRFELGVGTIDYSVGGPIPPQDLSFEWYTAFGQPAHAGTTFCLTCMPEPCSATLVGIALIGGLIVSRRRRM